MKWAWPVEQDALCTEFLFQRLWRRASSTQPRGNSEADCVVHRGGEVQRPALHDEDLSAKALIPQARALLLSTGFRRLRRTHRQNHQNPPDKVPGPTTKSTEKGYHPSPTTHLPPQERKGFFHMRVSTHRQSIGNGEPQRQILTKPLCQDFLGIGFSWLPFFIYLLEFALIQFPHFGDLALALHQTNENEALESSCLESLCWPSSQPVPEVCCGLKLSANILRWKLGHTFYTEWNGSGD